MHEYTRTVRQARAHELLEGRRGGGGRILDWWGIFEIN